jgi:riboflavin kinase/FMN adenylyltransferase
MDVRTPDEAAPSGVQSLAVGTFDGLHRGHREILGNALGDAAGTKRRAGVVTFEPDPVLFFQSTSVTERRILTRYDKIAILEKLGFDVMYEIQFDEDFASRSPKEFVEAILLDRLQAGSVHVGFNFRFGSKRKGDTEQLQELLQDHGATLTVQDPVQVGGETVSSSRIRELIRDGHVEEARRLLGRPYIAYEVLREGDGRGREIGFPTFNFPMQRTLHPRPGVYAVWLEADGLYPAVANFGRHPTVGNAEEPLLEVHVLDAPPELEPGDEAHVHFGSFLRDEQEFDGLTELKNQISRDVQNARQYHNNLDEPQTIASNESNYRTTRTTEV